MIVLKKKQVICTRMGPSISMRQEEFGMLYSGRGWAVLLRATTQPTGAAWALLWSIRCPRKGISTADQMREIMKFITRDLEDLPLFMWLCVEADLGSNLGILSRS